MLSTIAWLVFWMMPPCTDAARLEAERIGSQAGREARAVYMDLLLSRCEPDAAFMSHAALMFAEAAQASKNGRWLPDAYRLARTAIRTEPGSAFAHEIMSDVIAIDIELTHLFRKAVLADSVRLFATQALRLDPNRAKAAYILGRWHLQVADLPPYAAMIRTMLTPGAYPARYEDAVRYLELAYRLNPDPEIRQWLDVARSKSR